MRGNITIRARKEGEEENRRKAGQEEKRSACQRRTKPRRGAERLTGKRKRRRGRKIEWRDLSSLDKKFQGLSGCVREWGRGYSVDYVKTNVQFNSVQFDLIYAAPITIEIVSRHFRASTKVNGAREGGGRREGEERIKSKQMDSYTYRRIRHSSTHGRWIHTRIGG